MNYEKLINRIKQNDNSAVIEFYNEFYKEVYYVCYKITENEKDAEDIAQETLIRALDKIDTLKNPEGLSAWLRTIANNLSIKYLKKNRKFNIVNNSEEMGEEIFEENRIAQKTPEDIVADKEVTDILTNMINRLPREQRITIFMFYYEELSVKEIAEIMDCSEATVRSRINYARKALRKQVDELENKGVKLRCIAILPFLFTVYSFEKTGVCAAIAMPSAGALSAGVKGGAANLAKAGKVAGEAAKMSLKAKIAIGAVAAVVLVGGTVGVVSLATSGNNDSNEVIDNSDLVVEEENGQELTEEESKKSGISFWLSKQTWDKEFQTTFEGGLFNNYGDTSFDIKDLDETFAPFRFEGRDSEGRYETTCQITTNNVTDILYNENSYVIKWDDYWDDLDVQLYIYDDVNKPDFDYEDTGIYQIFLMNLSDNDAISCKECYENNWWSIDSNDFEVAIIKMLNLSFDGTYRRGEDESAILNAIVDKFGIPHKILIDDGNLAVYRDNDGFLFYDFIYEFDDCVLQIGVMETIILGETYSFNYNDVVYSRYYPTECWNKVCEKYDYNFISVDELR